MLFNVDKGDLEIKKKYKIAVPMRNKFVSLRIA